MTFAFLCNRWVERGFSASRSGCIHSVQSEMREKLPVATSAFGVISSTRCNQLTWGLSQLLGNIPKLYPPPSKMGLQFQIIKSNMSTYFPTPRHHKSMLDQILLKQDFCRSCADVFKCILFLFCFVLLFWVWVGVCVCGRGCEGGCVGVNVMNLVLF